LSPNSSGKGTIGAGAGVRYLKVSASFGMALQLPPMHEPPQQARPTLARFCFADETVIAFG